MPPRKFSRHTFALGIKDQTIAPEALQLTERQPFTYRLLSDTRRHTVREGESLWTLAARYFRGLPRAAGLWWVIADFQPDPIHDPTVALAPGRVLFIPSARTVQEFIFSENRRLEPEK